MKNVTEWRSMGLAPERHELCSARQLADGSGNVTLAQGYTPFGVPLWSEGSGVTGYGFTGERWEAYTGLLFLRARYYDSASGRFTTRDPWPGSERNPQTSNGWSYAEGNPTNRVDPSGHFSDCAIKRSLRGVSLDEAFGPRSGMGRKDIGRWGLLALLREAQHGNEILPLYPDFFSSYAHYPLRPSSEGAWLVECDQSTQEIVFSNAILGQEKLSLPNFLLQLNLAADQQVMRPNKWWRPRTLQLHWYELTGDKFYGDWIDPDTGGRFTDLPSLQWVSAEVNLGFGEQAGFILDRYGNQYASWGWAIGFGILPSWGEGYANDDFGRFDWLSEAELRGMIEGGESLGC